MSKRKIVKLNEDGTEMLDENGNYVFEEIELPETTPPTDAETSNSETTEDVVENLSNSIIEETVQSDNSAVDKENSESDKKIKELEEAIQLLMTQFGVENPIKKLEKIPEEVKDKISTSLGIDIRNIKLN